MIPNDSLFDATDLQSLESSRSKTRTTPLWKGPEKDGITASLLARFLTCRERFRILTIEGWKPIDRFDSKTEFGNLWHLCEEHWHPDRPNSYIQSIDNYMVTLLDRFHYAKSEIQLQYNMIRELFPRYIAFWENDPEQKRRITLENEYVFDTYYTLPSKRVVCLRGKWDALDLIETADGGFLYITDNKTKSTIDQQKITRQLRCDLQTMFYLVALEDKQEASFWNRSNKRWRDIPIGGIRYNVVRRPAHRSVESMLSKLELDFRNGRRNEWFDRWPIKVSQEAILTFRQQTLNPVLEQLCDWYEYISGTMKPSYEGSPIHWRQPYFYNPLLEGGFGEVDEHMETNSAIGLRQIDDLFPELKQ